jgi:hypothetical protein
MRYCSDGFGTIDAANIGRAARIFATRFAHQNMDRKVAIARYVFVSIEAFAEQALKRLSSYPSDLVQSRFQNATISRCSSCRTLSPRVQ